jgi:hypothetical protein
MYLMRIGRKGIIKKTFYTNATIRFYIINMPMSDAIPTVIREKEHPRLPLSVIAKSAAMKQSRGVRISGLLRCYAPANDGEGLHGLACVGLYTPSLALNTENAL